MHIQGCLVLLAEIPTDSWHHSASTIHPPLAAISQKLVPSPPGGASDSNKCRMSKKLFGNQCRTIISFISYITDTHRRRNRFHQKFYIQSVILIFDIKWILCNLTKIAHLISDYDSSLTKYIGGVEAVMWPTHGSVTFIKYYCGLIQNALFVKLTAYITCIVHNSHIRCKDIHISNGMNEVWDSIAIFSMCNIQYKYDVNIKKYKYSCVHIFQHKFSTADMLNMLQMLICWCSKTLNVHRVHLSCKMSALWTKPHCQNITTHLTLLTQKW